MRAAALRDGRLVVDTFPDPQPAEGELLARVLACGVCGSDLHFVAHTETRLAMDRELVAAGHPVATAALDIGSDIFLGHEFVAEVLELGPNTHGPAVGSVVAAIPLRRGQDGLRLLSYSNTDHAGFGELLVLSAELVRPVAAGTPLAVAALTEPYAVALHAVGLAPTPPGGGAVVIGCGPVGLTIVAALAGRNVAPIYAADFSPVRRHLAATMGAHRVVDPRQIPPLTAWREEQRGEPVTIFDAVGVPGLLDDIALHAPARSTIVTAGLCMEPDRLRTYFGVRKELRIQFSFGYGLEEFDQALAAIVEGRVDLRPLVTAELPLDELGSAFGRLTGSDQDCKILIRP